MLLPAVRCCGILQPEHDSMCPRCDLSQQPIAVIVVVIIIQGIILQHWQDQSNFPWWLQPTLCALAPSPACASGNWIIRESSTAYTSSIIFWYPQWLFIYCHLICTAQSPKGTSGSRSGGRVSSCKPLLVVETELPSHFCSQPGIWKSMVQIKTWQRNVMFTEKHIFLCFCEGAVAWKMKCYCWVKTACLSHSLTKHCTWTWIFLEPQPCMNSKLSREGKGINEVFVVRQSPLK